MSVIGCEHHSGMGLCRQCQADVEREMQNIERQATTPIRENKALLRRATDVLRRAGRSRLAEDIEREVEKA